MFWDSKEDENNFSEKKKKNGGVESWTLRFKISNDFGKYDLENALKSQKKIIQIEYDFCLGECPS